MIASVVISGSLMPAALHNGVRSTFAGKVPPAGITTGTGG
jgi:hypothetical protein